MNPRALALAAAIRLLADEPAHVRALAELLELELAGVVVRDAKPENVTRPPSMSPEAARSRRRRAAARAQLELQAVAPVADRSRPVATDTRPLSQDPDPPPTLKEIRKGSPSPVGYDPERPPVWLLAEAPAVRTDLAEYDLRDMWRSFCAAVAKRGYGHKDEADMRAHLRHWLRLEDRDKRGASREAYRTTKAETGGEGDEASLAGDGREVVARGDVGGLSASPATPFSDALAAQEEPIELPDDLVVELGPAELAKARLRAVPADQLAGVLRALPVEAELQELEDFARLFPFAAPEPRSMSA